MFSRDENEQIAYDPIVARARTAHARIDKRLEELRDMQKDAENLAEPAKENMLLRIQLEKSWLKIQLNSLY